MTTKTFFTGCLLFWVSTQRATAQKHAPGDTQGAPAKTIHLTAGQLKAYEGVFQNRQDKGQRLQFTVDSNCLQATLLYALVTLRIYPLSETHFYGKRGEPVSVRFIKNAAGKFNQLSFWNDMTWDRVANARLIVKKEYPHTPDQLKPYAGLYQFQKDSNRYFQLTVSGNQLVLKQLWDGKGATLVPDSTWDFFNKPQFMFSLHFMKGPDSTIEKTLTSLGDIWNKVQPLTYTPEQLSPFEGKYHLKEDPDDIIQIKASGNNLVVRQLWDGKETTLYPLADRYFYNDAASYPAKFLRDNSGAITTILLNDNLFIR